MRLVPLRNALGAELAGHDVTVGGVRLAFDDDGYGPAVVCLHAVGHGASDFRRVRERLRDRYRVIALDWPGHGRSGDDPHPASVVRYAELLRLFLLQAKIDRVVLVGNSIGGGAAIRYAADHSQHVRGLVLENPAGLDPRDRLSSLGIGAMIRLFSAGSREAGWYPFAFAQYYKFVLSQPAAAEQRARIVAAAVEQAPLLLQAWSSFDTPESDLRALAPQIACPVLFAWAERDRFVQLARNRPAIARFPNHSLETFRAGHCPHLEQPAEFETALEQFLAAAPS